MWRWTVVSVWCVATVGLAAVCAGAVPAGQPASRPATGEEILAYLDRVTDWYRRVENAGEAGGGASEVVVREGVRENARQVVGLAFDFAHAEAVMIEHGATTQPAAAGGQRGRNLAQVAATTEARVARLQRQVDAANAGVTTRPALVADRDRLVAQLNLAQAQRDVMQQYSRFVTAAESGDAGESFSKKIDDIEQTVPDARGEANATGPQQKQEGAATAAVAAAAAAENTTAEFRAETAGVFALVGRMFALSGRMSELNDLATDAGHIRDECERFRAPIRAGIVAAVRRGEAIESDATTRATSGGDLAEINGLTDQFRRLSAAGVPLGEQQVLLDAARQNLLNWRASLRREYDAAAKYLLIRVLVMVAVIGVLIVASQLWRRATYRYVHDVRRRRQLMLVRRVVVAGIVVLIVVAGVMTEFGSLATFAGLITAGIAVALQTVILSGVAYFFFIGRFGVRVGDRVTISGITGDVIEIGLLRLYMSELAGKPADLHPTGRIVVFSNAVLFQPTAFYKQMPGANYVWHEVAFTLAPETDVRVAEQRLLGAVEREFEGWRKSLARGAAIGGAHLEEEEALRPEGRLRMTASGLEIVVRYPVEVRRAAEEDNAVTRGVMAAIEEEPKLKLAGSGVIQA